MSSFYPDKAFYMFDKLLEQPGYFFQINTPQPEKIFKRLDRYQDYTGKAFYFWKNGQGLYRTDIPNIFAPNTGNFVSALLHVSLSIHFGIYLFTDVGKALYSPLAQQIIEKMQSNPNTQKKLLIFAGDSLDVPPQLSKYFTTIRHKVADSSQSSSQQMAS